VNNLCNFPCLALLILKNLGANVAKKKPDLAENMYQFAKSSRPGKCVVAQSIGTREPKWNDTRQVYGQNQSRQHGACST
jgi:hypothetical protein